MERGDGGDGHPEPLSFFELLFTPECEPARLFVIQSVRYDDVTMTVRSSFFIFFIPTTNWYHFHLCVIPILTQNLPRVLTSFRDQLLTIHGQMSERNMTFFKLFWGFPEQNVMCVWSEEAVNVLVDAFKTRFAICAESATAGGYEAYRASHDASVLGPAWELTRYIDLPKTRLSYMEAWGKCFRGVVGKVEAELTSFVQDTGRPFEERNGISYAKVLAVMSLTLVSSVNMFDRRERMAFGRIVLQSGLFAMLTALNLVLKEMTELLETATAVYGDARETAGNIMKIPMPKSPYVDRVLHHISHAHTYARTHTHHINVSPGHDNGFHRRRTLIGPSTHSLASFTILPPCPPPLLLLYSFVVLRVPHSPLSQDHGSVGSHRKV